MIRHRKIYRTSTRRAHRYSRVCLRPLRNGSARGRCQGRDRHGAHDGPWRPFQPRCHVRRVNAYVRSRTDRMGERSRYARRRIHATHDVDRRIRPQARYPSGGACSSETSYRSRPRKDTSTKGKGEGYSRDRASSGTSGCHRRIQFLRTFRDVTRRLLRVLCDDNFTRCNRTIARLRNRFHYNRRLRTTAVGPTSVSAMVVARVREARLLTIRLQTHRRSALQGRLTICNVPICVFLIPINVLLLTRGRNRDQHVFLQNGRRRTIAFLCGLFQNEGARVPVPPRTKGRRLQVTIRPTCFLSALIRSNEVIRLRHGGMELIRIVLLFRFRIFLVHRHLASRRCNRGSPCRPRQVYRHAPRDENAKLRSRLFRYLLYHARYQYIYHNATGCTRRVQRKCSRPVTTRCDRRNTSGRCAHNRRVRLCPSFARETRGAQSRLRARDVRGCRRPRTFHVVRRLQICKRPRVPNGSTNGRCGHRSR